MSKTVEKVVINPESIDVISTLDGVNSVTQLNLEPEDNEVHEIHEKYNLSNITNYPYDMKIVRALSENEEQLRNYLELCKNANNTNKRIELPPNTPEVEYDLKNLKKSDLSLSEQVAMYKSAKETGKVLKQARGKSDLKMSLIDRGYYTIQEFLADKNKKQTQALTTGEITPRRSIREELRDETLTEKTNQVAQEYAKQAYVDIRQNEELGELMDLVKDQLLERFEIQCNKRLYNFPFLLGQGVWIDSDKLKPNDRLRKVLKHGTLSIGFIGLAECLKALIGKHHGESDEAQKLGLEIIEFMRKRCDDYCKEYKLNFTLLATPAEGLSGRFVNIDKAVYGKIKGVTDREYYTNSFHVPVYYNISIVNKIKKEGPYHKYTNAGHISYIELDGDTTNNLEAFERIVRTMYENDMGYAAINHPVDRDPVCGYVGVIGDVCPGCGRKAYEGVPVERVNEYKNNCNC